MRSPRIALATAAVALAASAGASAATAADAPKPRDAFLDAVAAKLGVERSSLDAALKSAALARVDALAAAGKLDADRAAKLRARIEAGAIRLPQAHVRTLRARLLAAAAAKLGTTPRELREQLRSGSSLAGLAEAQGISLDDLEGALVGSVRGRVDAALAAGRIDDAKAQKRIARAEQRIERLVRHVRARS